MIDKESLKTYQKIVYVVDMINGFVTEGALHDEQIAKTIPNQIKILETFQKEKQAIAFIIDNHSKNAVEFKNFPEHCIAGTSEAEIVKELKPYEEQALVYLKNSTSGIFAPGFIEDFFSMQSLRQVIIVGCCTDICILNFAIPLKNFCNEHNQKIDIVVIENATETYHIANVHDRDTYTKMAYIFMQQAGIRVVKNFEEIYKL